MDNMENCIFDKSFDPSWHTHKLSDANGQQWRRSFIYKLKIMAQRIQAVALFLFLGKGGEDMMAMLWAQSIILGKKTYAQVPKLLKEKVKEILIDSGMEELITD